MVPNRLQEIRQQRGLLQKDLARLVECDKGTICRLEQGEYGPSYNLLRRLVQALQIKAHDLFPGLRVEEGADDAA